MWEWKILCRGSRLFKEIIFVCFDVCWEVTNVKDNACSTDFGVCLRAWWKVCQSLQGINKPYWVPTKLTLGFHPHLFSWAQELVLFSPQHPFSVTTLRHVLCFSFDTLVSSSAIATPLPGHGTCWSGLTHGLTSQLSLGLFLFLWSCLGDNCLTPFFHQTWSQSFVWLLSLSQCLPHHHTQSDDPNSWSKLAAFPGRAILTSLGYCRKLLPC